VFEAFINQPLCSGLSIEEAGRLFETMRISLNMCN